VDPLRVLVVGDDPLARAGLAALLSARPELAVVGEAAPDEVGAARGHDVVAWDLGPRGAAGSARPGAPAAPTVALVADEALAAEARRAGVRSVLLRSSAAGAVAAALAAAAHGLAVLDPALADAWLRAPADAPDGAADLTPREREVLELLAEGLANKSIAARLGISDHTAKFHVNAILGKLGAESRAEAIVKAARLGLVVL
jgi:DNA-binding NarL/FixJ family response regulator